MKCKHCDGTGRRMEESDNGIGWISIECEYCNGTGEVTQTNEEWFATLSTKEKAKALHKLHWEMQNHFNYSPDDEDYVEEYCLYWLKAIHK